LLGMALFFEVSMIRIRRGLRPLDTPAMDGTPS